MARPRTAIPEKEELIQLGKDLVAWASEKQQKGETLRIRYCDWYTEKGFVRKQWEEFRDKKEFSWYYEKARRLLALKYIDGTVEKSIAHRYLRMYDPELKDAEDKDAEDNELRKASAIKGQTKAIEEYRLEVLDEIQRNKRTPR